MFWLSKTINLANLLANVLLLLLYIKVVLISYFFLYDNNYFISICNVAIFLMLNILLKVLANLLKKLDNLYVLNIWFYSKNSLSNNN